MIEKKSFDIETSSSIEAESLLNELLKSLMKTSYDSTMLPSLSACSYFPSVALTLCP